MHTPALLAFSSALLASATVCQQALHVFGGESSADKFGYAVNTVGDLDGDGHDDVIVGAVFDDNAGSRSGTATVFSGQTGGVMFTFDGISAGDEFGYSVGPAGDVNGDGQPDFVIGAIGHHQGRGPFNGAAYVYSGDTGTRIREFYGESAYDYMGLSIRAAGDVNSDGYDDIVIGIPGEDNNGSSSGSVHVYSGKDSSLLWSQDGDGPNDQLGWWVAIAGDVNDDGFCDIVAGAPRPNGFVPGYARVFSGRDGSTIRTVYGDSGGDRFGWCVGFAGDVNHDGVDDFIVGAPFDDDVANSFTDAGAAKLFSGADGAVLRHWRGDAAGDKFGWSVAGLGDVNGDSYPDLGVGAHLADSNGVDAGICRVFSGQDGSTLHTVVGTAAGDNMGFAVGSAGDVNADGYIDVIVGAIFEMNAGVDAGAAKVLSFGTGGTPPKTRVMGVGCAGTNGSLPRISVYGRMGLGESYEMALRGARPNAQALLFLGVEVPIVLGDLAPGCDIRAYPLVTDLTTTNADGIATIVPSICPLPTNTVFIGSRLTHQWVVLDPGNNPIGIAVSNLAYLTIGN